MEEFKGNPVKIDPRRLIKENTENGVDDFFLVLATIFNDLKDTLAFQIYVENNYRKLSEEELSGQKLSGHLGEHSGIIVHTNKNTISLVNEFLAFIKENESVLSNIEFQLILKNVSKEASDKWKEIIYVATEQKQDDSDFVRALKKVRNNVGFHYYQSAKNLRRAFVNRFFKKDKKIDTRNTSAYYSMGDTMEDTRFYYADAIIEEYMEIIAREKTGEDDKTWTRFYQKEMAEMVRNMVYAIVNLLREYLKRRQNRR